MRENIHSITFMYGSSECLCCKRKYTAGHVCRPKKVQKVNMIQHWSVYDQVRQYTLSYNDRINDGFAMYQDYFIFRNGS
jgi:hypothetical protein